MTSVRVELYVGEATYPRAVWDVFTRNTLTITSADTGAVLRTYPPGDWIHATMYDDQGYPVTSYQSSTPPKPIFEGEALTAFLAGFRR